MYKDLKFREITVKYKVKVMYGDQEREEERERKEIHCEEFPPWNRDKMAEFLILPTYSYFGDYQIFGDHRS